MGEGLGVVAEVALGDRVHLLGVKPERAGERTEFCEEFVGFSGSPGHREGLHEPERAGKKGALGAGKAVLAGRVTVDERPAGAELLGYCVDGAAYARRVGGFEVEQWEHENRGVKIGGTIGAGVAAELAVEAPAGDIGGDGGPLGLPSFQLSGWSAVGGGNA